MMQVKSPTQSYSLQNMKAQKPQKPTIRENPVDAMIMQLNQPIQTFQLIRMHFAMVC